MQAVQLIQFGELAKAFQIASTSLPILNKDEVLVRVIASGINMSDVKEAHGLMPHVHLPIITGRSFAGIVEDGDESWKGKEVWGVGGDLGFSLNGTHAKFVKINKDAVRAKPKTVSFQQAASLGVPYITAFSALERAGNIEGKTICVNGANGNVGTATLQIAKMLKAGKVVGTVRKEINNLKDITRADQIVVTDGKSQNILETVGIKGFDVVVDTVGGPTFNESLALLAPRGTLVVMATPPTQKEVPLDILGFYRKDLTLSGVNTLSLSHIDGARILDKLLPGFESGALVSKGDITELPLSKAVEGFEATQKGLRVVLIPE